jgi:RimJ/RimL family protein N-acetyltransferase
MYHIHILDKHQAKGYVFKGWEVLHTLLKDSNINTIVGSVPIENENMMKVVMKTNFKCCGTIPNGIIYNNKLQDLVLFSLEVK